MSTIAICAIITASVVSITAIAALIGWLLRVRAEISSLSAQVAAMESTFAAQVDAIKTNCISRKEWLLTIAHTLQTVDKNQTKLAAMLGVDIQEQ